LKSLVIALIGTIALGIGCAKAQVVRKSPPPPVAVSVAPAEPAVKPAPALKPAPLPDVPLEGMERTRASAAEFRRPARRYTLVMAAADARELFLSLARENDFNLVLSPEVSGTVTMDIKEATAEELMDEVCGMLGCRAVFDGNTVRVAPERRVTRVFPVDYLLTGRTGSGSLMASTSTSGGGGGGGPPRGVRPPVRRARARTPSSRRRRGTSGEGSRRRSGRSFPPAAGRRWSTAPRGPSR